MVLLSGRERLIENRAGSGETSLGQRTALREKAVGMPDSEGGLALELGIGRRERPGDDAASESIERVRPNKLPWRQAASRRRRAATGLARPGRRDFAPATVMSADKTADKDDDCELDQQTLQNGEYGSHRQ